MSVAKSYERFPIDGEPYERNKKEYVKIQYPCCRKASCSKCGGQGYYLKEVRWYEEPITFNARKGFGFYEAGYITIFKGDVEEIREYMLDNLRGLARNNTLFGWHLPSNYELPNNIPPSIKPVRLAWEQVSSNDKFFDYDVVRGIVAAILKPETALIKSEYVGEIGDKIAYDFTVISASTSEGYYGDSVTHILEDEFGNRYIWKTSARKLTVGEIYSLKGTIKEHSKIEGIKHTILTRCREG